ncbi:MAG: multidrug efflux SMR transporter [Mycetocola sp.]
MTWILLGLAIAAEVVATAVLPRTEGFRRLAPSIAVASLYVVAFYFLAQTLRTLELGITYALWAGIGTAAIALIGILCFQESASLKKIGGILCIVAGVVVLNLGGAA